MNLSAKISLFVILFILFLGCTKKEKIYKIIYVAQGRILSIRSKDSIKLGQSDSIKVVFEPCCMGSRIHHVAANLNGDTLFFKAFYQYPKDPPNYINDTAGHRLQKIYIFKPDRKGTFIYTPTEINTSAKTVVY